LENDNRFIFKAAAKAQKASDYILDRNAEDIPKYLQNYKPKTEPKPKAKKETAKTVVDYVLLDNITAQPVASKKTLKELEKAFYKLEQTEIGKNSKPLVYEIVSRNGKNAKGNKVNVDWEKPEPKPEPKGFDKKPKSVSVQTAIKDVLSLQKYKNTTSLLVASLLYKLFKDDLDAAITPMSDYEIAVLKKDSDFHFGFSGKEILLTSLGIDFVKSVNGRLDSLQNQKHNYALFDGLGLPSPKKERVNISSDNFKNMSVPELRKFTFDYYNENLKGNTVEIKNHLKEVVFITDSGRKLMKPMYKEKTAVIEHLEEIIKNSTYNNWGDRKTKDNPTVLGYLNFKSKVTIDGIKRHVRISIILDRDRKTLFKSFDVGAKEKEVKHPGATVVNPKDGGIKPLSENKNTKKSRNNKKNPSGLGLPEAPGVPISEIPVTETIVISTEPVIPVTATPGKIINPAENCTEIPKNDSEVSQNNTQNPEIKPEVSKPVKSRLMSMEFESLEMDEGWEDFMQEPAANMKLAIFGKPKNGKTAGALQFAKYLTKHGNVLYNFADQGFNKNTQDLWITAGFENCPEELAKPSDANTLAELEKEIGTGNYKYVFIDMINDYINRENITPHEFKDRFIRKYPEVGFILVMESTKTGNFKGDQAWTHVVDAIVTVEDFCMENRGRYGIGHHVVWEEGLQKFNPKKFEELYNPDDVPVTEFV
jgi:hypothetical protein